MRLPVSTNTVAIMVRLPPSSILRAAPAGFGGQVVGPAQTSQAIEEHHYVTPCFHQAFGSLQHHFGETSMRLGWFVKGRTDDLGLHGALQIGDFLRALSD